MVGDLSASWICGTSDMVLSGHLKIINLKFYVFLLIVVVIIVVVII